MKKVFFLLLLKAIGAGSSLLLGMAISRYFGVDILGQYGLVTTYILILSLVANWGNYVHIIEFNQRTIHPQFLGFWALTSCLITAFSVWLFQFEFGLWYIGFVVLFYSFFYCKSSIFIVNQMQYLNTSIDDGLRYLLPLIFILAFSYFMEGVDFFWLYFYATFSLFLFSACLTKKYVKNDSKSTAYHYKDLLKYGTIPTLSALFVLLNAQFDRIILSYFVEDKAVGVYVICYSFMALISYFSASVMAVVTPNIVNLYKQQEYTKLYNYTKKYTVFLCVFSFSIVAISALIGDFLFYLYSVENTYEGYVSLLILMLGVSFSQIWGFGMTLASYTENKKILLKYQAIVFCISALLCIFLAHLYGIIGAAISTALGVNMIKALVWNYYRRENIKLGII
ncbi:oligosaccharide flippase family protein [Actinobacillus equuli subsp. equuli]|uniref:oligosaccharide flippase family protein n=1 Tax=Actinobacillus equuli TaxID=718 RepID=UPI0024181FE5|nr:oligosaccharide flippase family protein [Actinobacillus equuli]MDG4951640.1 oligosaccharide flippase family protein [Actinobacillus equuli subsp. equuli]WGE55129.1 oligosaccharide flippase family protein [Actinobacillus equuli subsp. equuli]WGE65407.1 oligosaccharide flippase family protein [Actinobacillus equuli subsp. equuli]WGE79391.1 oligosaccharide flippase family protein [Actinobacillus equuli subsp. equuli]